MVYTLRFFSLQNAVCFIILTYLVPALFTFYIQGVLKLKKNNSGTKRLKGRQSTFLKQILSNLKFFGSRVGNKRITSLCASSGVEFR